MLFKKAKSQIYDVDDLYYDGALIQYFDNPSEKLCLIAVTENGEALQHIKNQTKEICIMAIQQDICLLAIQSNPYAIIYVKK